MADLDKIQSDIQTLSEQIIALQAIVNHHKHDGVDGSARLLTNVDLKAGQSVSIGNVAQLTGQTDSDKTTRLQLISGNDSNLADGQQVSNIYLDHESATDTPQNPNGTNTSYFYGIRGPIFEGSSGVAKTGNSVMTQSDWTFKLNQLKGAFVTIEDPVSGAISDSLILSNTANSITISGSFNQTLQNLNYIIYVPIYLGNPTFPWRKIYTLGGDGGVIFGFNSFSGQLYMKSDGSLHWIAPSGNDYQVAGT